MYGLTKVEAGLYEHSSGVLIIRTDGWEGPRSRELIRWEHAERQPDGAILVGSLRQNGILYRTLREAAAALEA